MSAASRIEAPNNPACFLCRVNHARYSHVVNTKRVRNHDRAPLSITNKYFWMRARQRTQRSGTVWTASPSPTWSSRCWGKAHFVAK
jgi:hypothetical protein